ncbi:vacuolar import and degradation protein-domain-containing protein [Dichomitus squalens]|nr:vacuolar import and degradation protein-domain-containing protein [Dichomitus squalens]
MPAEHATTSLHDPPQPDPQQSQVKLCLACRCPLTAEAASTPFSLHGHDTNDAVSLEASPVCASCRIPLAPPAREGLFAEVERELLRRAASLQPAGNEAPQQVHELAPSAVSPSPPTIEHCPSPQDIVMEVPAAAPRASTVAVLATELSTSSSGPATVIPRSPRPPSSTLNSPILTRPTLAPIDTSNPPSSSQTPSIRRAELASASQSGYRQRSHASSSSGLDPLLDITRLRVRSQGHHCLYPGATFQGTQKSGRNSYDVNVTIVDVDFSSSHLCGYLRIRGLTDDWPELTTYFDAEIIGSRYGFLTRNWGANEQEDMVHWARFPAFRHVKNELKKPHLTMQDALNRGAVFMRWKEKFLVPDHRVQDINGASFAGFYYVCVDFNPQQSGAVQLPSPVEENVEMATSPTTTHATKPETPSRSRRISVTRGARRAGRSASRGIPSNVATMSGFYFHQNSEPYQQLSLVHVPERTSSCFEFR